MRRNGLSDSTQLEGSLDEWEFSTFAGKDGNGNISNTTYTLPTGTTAEITTLDYLRFRT